MAGHVSKDAERKALDQIRKIVSDLGPGSYLEATFKGCFELAESNIDNDFMISFKDSNDYLSEARSKCARELADAQDMAEDYARQLNEKSEELKKLKMTFNDYCECHKLTKENNIIVNKVVKEKIKTIDDETSSLAEDFKDGRFDVDELAVGYRKVKANNELRKRLVDALNNINELS